MILHTLQRWLTQNILVYLQLVFEYCAIGGDRCQLKKVIVLSKYTFTMKRLGILKSPINQNQIVTLFYMVSIVSHPEKAWWRHQMEKFSALLATGGFPSQRLVTRSFIVLLDRRQNKRMSKQSKRCWFETQPRPSLRLCKERKPPLRQV